MDTSPLGRFIKSMKDVERLLEIHQELTGDAQGRRYRVEVLNKSALVLITACWEAVIEDIASESFDFMLSKASSYSDIPRKVRVLASGSLRNDKDESKVWELAEDGWKTVMKNYKENVLLQFHTPDPVKIDELFRRLLGIKSISSIWYWQKTSVTQTKKRLNDHLNKRHLVVHGTSSDISVTKPQVEQYQEFVHRLAVKTSNHVRKYISSLVGKHPWSQFRIGNLR